MPLPGQCQTNQRAELYAVLHVLENYPPGVNIHTDSQYVFDGCCKHRHTWQATGWHIHHADLWIRVDNALQRHGPDGYSFTKVKGHAKLRD
eukprot:920218-Karenia_brevis.AAC.1